MFGASRKERRKALLLNTRYTPPSIRSSAFFSLNDSLIQRASCPTCQPSDRSYRDEGIRRVRVQRLREQNAYNLSSSFHLRRSFRIRLLLVTLPNSGRNVGVFYENIIAILLLWIILTSTEHRSRIDEDPLVLNPIVEMYVHCVQMPGPPR